MDLFEYQAKDLFRRHGIPVPDGRVASTAAGAERVAEKIGGRVVVKAQAGIFAPRAFEDISDAEWMQFFETNVMSGVRLSRHYVRGMLTRDWGRIIFISSESGVFIPSDMIHSGMTKTAELAVSRGLAEYCSGTGVTVNSVLPGPTWVEMVDEFVQKLSAGQSFEAFEKEFFKSVRPPSLLKRFATAEEVASLVTYVCSPLASAINGASVRADGGVVRSIA